MLDDYVTFGRTGLRVSRHALGTFNFGGSYGWSIGADGARAILDRYRALGGNFLDTANIYGGGATETILGEWLGAEPGLRDSLVIASKFGGSTTPGDPNAGGGGRKAIVRACEESLRRLRTDRIDLYWMHLWDVHTPIEETLRTLDDLVAAGKLLHYGLSNFPAWKTAEAHWVTQLCGYAPLAGLQLQYSLLERSIEAEIVPMAQAYGLGIAAWSPLKSGALSGRYSRATVEQVGGEGRGPFVARALDERGLTVLDQLAAIAQRRGVPVAQVALAWLQAQPAVDTILLGAHDVAQLEENAGATALTLGAEELAELDAVTRPPLAYPADFARRSHGSVSGGTRINGMQAPAGTAAPSRRAQPPQQG